MMDAIKSLFTPEQWATVMGWLITTAGMLLNNALIVLWVAFLVFASTQVVKISWQRSKRLKGPPDWAIHAVSVLSAIGWGYAQNAEKYSLDERAAIALAAWFLTWFAVTYGGGIMKEYRPKLWSAINFSRRKLELGPPPATPERRGRRKKP